MAEHIWTVFCEKAIIDQSTSNISLIEIVEHLNATPVNVTAQSGASLANLPSNRPLTVVSLWTRNDPAVPEKPKCRLSLLLPNGKKETAVDYEADLTKTSRARITTNLGNIPIAGSGRYAWIVQSERESQSGKKRWIAVAKVIFDVTVQEPSEPTAEGQQLATSDTKKRSKKRTPRQKKKAKGKAKTKS